MPDTLIGSMRIDLGESVVFMGYIRYGCKCAVYAKTQEQKH